MTEKTMEKRENRMRYICTLAGVLIGCGVSYAAYRLGQKSGITLTLTSTMAMSPELSSKISEAVKNCAKS